MRYRERESTDQEINISPLIDIVFILLIFFMVSATFVKDYNLDISRPKASFSTAASAKAIRVFINSDNDVFIDGNPVRIWVIQSYIREKLAGGDKTVLVVTDEGVPANRLIEVIDQCRLAGAVNVGVATEQEGA